jgi:hypothetical protein
MCRLIDEKPRQVDDMRTQITQDAKARLLGIGAPAERELWVGQR